MRKKSIKEIKRYLDTMLIPAWKEYPAGYECSQITWDQVDAFIPKIQINYKAPSSSFRKTFIHIREDVADGFHPVYEWPDKHSDGKVITRRHLITGEGYEK